MKSAKRKIEIGNRRDEEKRKTNETKQTKHKSM